jgi:hypothetical protein
MKLESGKSGEHIALPLDSPLTGEASSDRHLMLWSFFALDRDIVTELPVYDDGTVRIQVTGTKLGVATMWDKELLVYIASIAREKLERGEEVGQSFTFTAADYFKVVGKQASGRAYEQLEESLARLQSTQIRTNIQTGGEGEDGAFSWILDYKTNWRRSRRSEGKIMQSVTVAMCRWLHRAILLDRNMLTLNGSYFQLTPLQKRLYEIAHAHCATDLNGRRDTPAIFVRLEDLHRQVSSMSDLRDFKRKLSRIMVDGGVPDYEFALVYPTADRLRIDCGSKAAAGRAPRVPLKNHYVLFWRAVLDRLPDPQEIPLASSQSWSPPPQWDTIPPPNTPPAAKTTRKRTMAT